MVAQNSALLPTNFGKNQDTSTTGYSSGDTVTDSISEATSGHGITLNHVLNTGAAGISAIAGFSGPTVFHSGGFIPYIATAGTDVTPATTVTYAVEVYIEQNATITGVSYLTGSSVAGNVMVSLADSTGAPIAAAISATTSITVTAGYQQIPFIVAYAAKGPARYYILIQFDNTGGKFRALPVGNFRAGSITAGTYGTFTTVAAITSFTTNVGPIADTY